MNFGSWNRRTRNPAAPSIYPGPHPDGVPMAPSFNGGGSTGGPPSYPGASFAPAPRQRAAADPSFASAVPAPVPGPGMPMTPRLQNALQYAKSADFAGGAPANFTAPNLPQTNSASAYGNVDQSKAARYAFVQDQQRKANALSGGYPQAFTFANDANQRANDEAQTYVDEGGSPKDQELRARAAKENATATVGIPGMAQARQTSAGATALNAQTKATAAAQPSALDKSKIGLNTARTAATTQKSANDTTAIQAKAGQPSGANVRVGLANATALQTSTQMKVKRLTEQYNATMRNLQNPGIDPGVAAELHTRAAQYQKDIAVAQKAADDAVSKGQQMRSATTQPSQGEQPGASAVPIHVNHATGERIKWDGQQWQPIA